MSEIEEVVMPEFPQFDVVTDYSDHQFAKRKAQEIPTAGTLVYMRIMREWKILGQDLPEGIYVRTFEERIDILRAVIVGSKSTPYHDGLFFFDIAFPKDYPSGAPKVHYRSYGYTLNPIIGSSGSICLSLLRTAYGKSREAWKPSSSSILQILVSLQALVLSKIYVNNGDKALRYPKSYKRIVFTANCKTMHSVLRNPPRNFKEFVVAHFRNRACVILKAIEAYKTGAVEIGRFNENQQYLITKKVSSSFAKEMKLLYSKLYAEFLVIKAPGLDKIQPTLTKPESKKTTGPSNSSHPNATSTEKKAKKSIKGKLLSMMKKVLKMGGARSSHRGYERI